MNRDRLRASFGLFSLTGASLLAAALVGLSASVHATEGGIGYYVPGTAATLIDRAPLQTGWVFEPMYLHYEGDFSAGARVPIAGLVTAGVDVTIDSVVPGALYTFESPVLGAKYSIGAYLSWISVDVSASLDSPLGSIRRSDSASGLGDTTLIPVMLGWVDGNWQYNALLPVHAPTGDYETGRLANPGLNYWSADPTFGIAYANQESGFNATMFTGITLNQENSDTDYRSGRLFHIDGSVQQMIKAGSGFLTLGFNAFWGNQVSDDKHTGRFVGAFRQETVGIGPVIGYVLPKGKDNILVEFRWLPQLDSTNTTEGDYFWLKFVYQVGTGQQK
ncbi:SphA family protein [Microbulbifer pacificus]|uniref:Transporter n=1 Tax=Microbulbifer pacificus TaxID=407164 RepID=A0AAU0N3A1_9GAMM|nr:transporter [Microbulbifer pacificus]WOX07255.1 transporter [Microbulbifer pacificus]